MKRTLFTWLLLAIMTVGILASCAKDTPPEPVSSNNTAIETSSVPETIDPSLQCNLPEKDWNGQKFHVLAKLNEGTASFCNFEIATDGENGEIFNDTLFRRNIALEEQYNVKITQELFTDNAGDTGAQLRRTVLAGESKYDLSMHWCVDIGSLAAEGLFFDLNSIGYADYEKAWWNADANAAMTLGGKLFFGTNDFLLHDKMRAYILIYNADLAQDLKLGNLSDYVREGSWTIDKMLTTLKTAARDANGDGVMDANDYFGLIAGARKDCGMFTCSMGNTILSHSKDGSLVISMMTEQMNNSIDKFLALMDLSTSAFPEDFKGKTSSSVYSYATSIFMTGHALFNSTNMCDLKACSEQAVFDYRVLPMPKYNEAQEKYYTQPDDIALLFAIPLTAPDKDFAGFMLEALAYASSTTTLPVYYETCCKNKYSNDKESAEMLDIAMDGLVYDTGFIFDLGGLRSIIISTIPVSRQNTLASSFAAARESAEKSISDTIKSFEALNK